ncbi:ADS_G0030800.mRNA.1.CDS.1 [Saccharomyces cerevisiae]|nr:ADS_G0030800.mRNA.1.CDS.1 [Saccharomyces cerevisiae]CAI6752809.1 ADS_G0030800.mRNA.1.CDS.1 [Saccharomyces cerevisiae]
MEHTRCSSSSTLKLTLLTFHSIHPSLTISTKCTRIIMHGTCLSGLYPVPFSQEAHDYPPF